MNHTYRLVFNKALGLVQVVSELANCRGKKSAVKSSVRQADSSFSENPSVPFKLKPLATALLFSLSIIAITATADINGGNGSPSPSSGGIGGVSNTGGGSGGNGGGYYRSSGYSSGGGGGAGGGRPTSGGSGGSTGGSAINYGRGGAGGNAGAYGHDNNTSSIFGGAGQNGGAARYTGGGGGGGGVGLSLDSGANITNSGSITGGLGGNGGNTYISGAGSGGGGGAGISGDNFTINNSSNITGGDGGAYGFSRFGASGLGGSGGAGIEVLSGSGATITNSLGGTISGGAGGSGGNGGAGISITGSGTTTITNNTGGSITGGAGGDYGNGGAGIAISSGTNTINNSGSITGGAGGYYGNGEAGISITGSGTTTITNSGSITGGYGYYGNGGAGISITGSGTTTITNSGSITGGAGGDGYYGGAGIFIASDAAGTVNIINQGTILGASLAVADIINNASTQIPFTLSNAQSGLTLSGHLPTTYNIIINSTSSFGTLVSTNSISTDRMTFGISSLSAPSASIAGSSPYDNVLKGVTAAQLGLSGVSYTGTSNGYKYTLYEDTLYSNWWDLLILRAGPDPSDTQASMQYQARQLRSAFNSQTMAANFALNYDCNVFDMKGMCLSAGGRYTTIDNPGINNSAAVVTLGYKVNPNIRIGAYLDQNINISKPTGINISNNTPLMGLYAVWNKEQSGLGYQIRLANTYQEKDVTQTRSVFSTSEAGSGKSSLKSQSYLAELSYAFQYEDKTLVRPYAGLRYTHLKQDGYTEATVTGSVEDPLTVAALKDRSATALLGVKVNRSLTDKATLTAQLGLEQDLYHKVDNYSATDLNGSDLTAVAFNSNIKRTRPVASLGAFYDVTKTQRASATLNYTQLPFQSTSSVTGYFNYTIGF